MINVHVEDLEWAKLPVTTRAELLRNQIPFPGETAEERRCRVKAQLGLFDDNDLMALADVEDHTLAKHRVKGTGPRPIRVLRSVFYTAEDIRDWLLKNRDAIVEKGAKA